MAKKNKGTTRHKRHSDNVIAEVKMAARAEEEDRLRSIYEVLMGLPFDKAISTLIRATIGLEKTAADLGIEFDKESPRFSGGDFILCRKCAFGDKHSKDDAGIIGICTAMKRSDGTDILTCRSDGCTFGISKE